MRCPDPQALEDLALGRLTAESRAACEAHIDGCPECARLVAELARVYATGDLATAPTVLRSASDETRGATEPIGTQVGRYRLEGKLGSGGMGVVFSAYDPELDRRVAIKLLHPGVFADADEQRARLRKEAQAMAKLSHPNVVSVYDVGAVGDQVFLAAELVDGSTLSRWLRASPRPRQEILRCFLEAGQGLEAAHQAGIVHRDFKPDNVLIGRDGRARVTDFGLARSSLPAAGEPSLTPAPAPTTLTRTGALVGTPPYMAPELWLGRRADPLSDQFAFTVALYEAIFGVRPFAGEDLGELARAIAAGAVRPVPRGTPAWLSRLLARGLAVAPEKRFRSMAELLHELRRDRRRPLRIGLWATAIALAATGLALGFGAFLQPPPAPPLASPRTLAPSRVAARTCSVGAIAAAWNPERKRAVEQAFAGTWPASLGKRVAAGLDSYALRFGRAREAICAKPELPPGSHRCLERRREALAALVSALRPERRRLRLARTLVDELPAPESCVEGGPLVAEPAPSAQGRAALLHADLVAARVELEFLETLKAKDEIERLRPAAEALGYAPLVAEALLVDGLVRRARGELSPAAELLEQALGTARASRDLELAREAALALVDLAGELASPAERWVRQAGELLPRADPAMAQRLAVTTARALRASGELLKAEELIEARRGAAPGGVNAIALGVAASENALALEQSALALERSSAAAREAERAWDAEDPGWIAIEHARARALSAAGRGEEALSRLRRAETLAFDAYGLGAEAVARSYDETGAVLEALGRHAAAREKYARALSARTLIRDDRRDPSRACEPVARAPPAGTGRGQARGRRQARGALAARRGAPAAPGRLRPAPCAGRGERATARRARRGARRSCLCTAPRGRAQEVARLAGVGGPVVRVERGGLGLAARRAAGENQAVPARRCTIPFLALVALVSSAACQTGGLVTAVLIGAPLLALSALLVGYVVRTIIAGRRAHRRWLEGASVGSGDLLPGELVWITFQPRPGASYVVWLELDVEGETHSFELALTVRGDGGTSFDQAWRAWLDDDADDSHHLRSTSLVDAAAFPEGPRVMLNPSTIGWRWRAIHRVLPFAFTTAAPASVGVRLRATERTTLRKAHAWVTLGEAP